jgi:hypothetical protein
MINKKSFIKNKNFDKEFQTLHGCQSYTCLTECDQHAQYVCSSYAVWWAVTGCKLQGNFNH